MSAPNIHTTPWRLTKCSAAATVSEQKMAFGDERNCLGVWISQFRICPAWESVCNPRRKTTLEKQPHDSLRPLYGSAGFSHSGFLTDSDIFSQGGKTHCLVCDDVMIRISRVRKIILFSPMVSTAMLAALVQSFGLSATSMLTSSESRC